MTASATATCAVDVAVLGAGPAGIGAAIAAHVAGRSVLLIDEAPAAGGQIYRKLPDSLLLMIASHASPATILANGGQGFDSRAAVCATLRLALARVPADDDGWRPLSSVAAALFKVEPNFKPRRYGPRASGRSSSRRVPKWMSSEGFSSSRVNRPCFSRARVTRVAMAWSRRWSSAWVGAATRWKRGVSSSNVQAPSTKSMWRVRVEVQRRSEALDEGDGAGARTGTHARSGAAHEEGGDRPVDDAQDSGEHRGACREQEP